jgi:hypothetical protein
MQKEKLPSIDGVQYGRERVTDTNRENGWYIQCIMK